MIPRSPARHPPAAFVPTPLKPKAATHPMRNAKPAPATTELVKPYEPTAKERDAVEAYRDRQKRERPQIRAKASLEPDHPDTAFGHLLLLTALGSTQTDFSLGLLAQLANAASKGRTV